MPEYISIMEKKELALNLIKGLFLVGVTGYFFYRSVVITIMFIPAIYPYLIHKGKEYKRSKNNLLLLQFKDMLGSVGSSVQAGYSLENAFIEAERDMRRLHGDDAVIVKELNNIKSGIENNYSITVLIRDFSKRYELEEIDSFASILQTGKKAGGNMNKIMNSYIRIIEEKTAVLQEIDTMTASRRFEQKIMNVVPFFIIFYVELTSKGFFDILYHNLFGNLVMTVTLGIYLLSVYMAERMTDISI